jgi:hypothetical protein
VTGRARTVSRGQPARLIPMPAELRSAERALFRLRAAVQVGTVHTFQGSERDIMIMSLVAAHGVPPQSSCSASRH